MSIRDCYGISRSIAETAINVAYILALGKPVADRAQQHALYMSYKDLHRSSEMAGYSFEMKAVDALPDPSTIPGLENALSAFGAGKRGGKNWIDENLEKRVSAIKARYGKVALNFAAAVQSIYRHSSEILHGTFFGVQYFWLIGGQKPKNEDQVLYHFLMNHAVAVYSTAFFACSGISEIVAKEFGAKALMKKNEKLFQEFSHFIQEVLAKTEPPASLRKI